MEATSRFTGYNLAGFVISTLAGFVGGIVIARTVHGVGVGQVAAAWAVVELARPWGALSTVPAIRRSFEERDPARVWGTSLAMHLAAMGPAVALLVALSGPLADALNSTPAAVAISATYLLAFIPASVGLAVLDARKDFARRNAIVVLTNVSYLGLLLAFTVTFPSVESVVAANVLSTAIASAVCLRYMARPRFDSATTSYLLRAGSRMVVIMFAGQVVLWLGPAIATGLVGASDGGTYRVASALAVYAYLLPEYVVLTWTVPAASGTAVAGGDLRALYVRSTATAVGLAGVVLAAIAVAGGPLLGVYGEEFVEGYALMVALGGAFTLASFGVSATGVLYALERTDSVMWAAVARGSIFLGVTLVLIGAHGLWAIAVGVAASSAVSAVALLALAAGALGRSGAVARAR